jgi:ribosome maturation factor RimP
MIDKNKILKVIETADLEKEFVVVDIDVKPVNKFTVYLESLAGITIGDCIMVSRLVEQNFNRDEEDYELNVSSAGIDRPLIAPLQYIKNIGRDVEVKLSDGDSFIGKLTEYNERTLKVICQVKEKDEKSKKTKKFEKEFEIELSNIKTVTVVVSFK